MKIFIVASTHPEINSSTNIIIKNILKNLEKNIDLNSIWFVYQSKLFKKLIDNNETIIPIQDYQNAVEALSEFNPDCVLTNNNKFTDIQYAFSLAANFLNIPLIQYKNADLTFDEISSKSRKIKSNFKRNITQFFSNVPQNNGMKRGSFILYKKKFLYETNKALGVNTFKNFNSQINDYVYHFIGDTKKRFSNLANLQLVHSEVWLKILQEGGVDSTKLVLTGNPYWDNFYEISKKLVDIKKPITRKPVRLLISTTPLLEHGYWKTEQKEEFLGNLIKFLKDQPDYSCSFKIHPSSEDIDFYKSFFKKFNVSFPIYQKESTWSIANNFDLIISYGYSTIHTECALFGFRLILINTNLEIREMPLVKSGIDSGFIKKCDNIHEISSISKQLCEQEIHFNDLHKHEIKKIIYKFDGKSGERAANAILKLLSR